MALSTDPRLIECVPNFSEGRDPAVIEAILHSITQVKDCEVWDHSADPDHNRSVFTIAGTPEALEEAAIRFTRTASERINMETHSGVHPCIGSTDVIPFIPLRNTTMSDCILLSRRVGERIASELGLPVYLYANSALTEKHRRLADIRRGGYAVLKERIAVDPDRAPDLGPAYLTAAGGVSVGARDILIAWNVYLDTTDLTPARKISRLIRESSGGLPGVQAIGLFVNGLAQISMNLLDYRRTSLKDVFQSICDKANELGCTVHHSELIGMLPRAALDGTSPEELRLQDFNPDRILEEHFQPGK